MKKISIIILLITYIHSFNPSFIYYVTPSELMRCSYEIFYNNINPSGFDFREFKM
jgi:hypothetical protein